MKAALSQVLAMFYILYLIHQLWRCLQNEDFVIQLEDVFR